MATTTFGEETSIALKCQTWVLKVSIHCQGCKRKVKKVLRGIDGVYTAAVDSQQQRVTVTGNIEVETLIKKLIKIGKHAEIWSEKPALKEKESAKAKAMHNQKDSKKGHDINGRKNSVKFSEEGTCEKTKELGKSPEDSIEAPELPTVKNTDSGNEGGGGVTKSGGKKKKNKGQRGDNGSNHSGSGSPSSGAAAGTGNQTQGMGIEQVVDTNNLHPTRHCSVPLPHPVYGSSYNMAYPRESPGPFYYVPVYTQAQPSRYNQVSPVECLYYFSDENVNGCSIM